mgnify:CR=1 FL=1
MILEYGYWLIWKIWVSKININKFSLFQHRFCTLFWNIVNKLHADTCNKDTLFSFSVLGSTEYMFFCSQKPLLQLHSSFQSPREASKFFSYLVSILEAGHVKVFLSYGAQLVKMQSFSWSSVCQYYQNLCSSWITHRHLQCLYQE